MAQLSREEMQEIEEFGKKISIAQLNLDNASLYLELEKSRFETYKLSLFRKYKIEDNMYIDKDGQFKPMEEIKE